MVTPERAILTDKLTVVLGFSELLMEDAYGRLDPRQRQVLAEVVQAAALPPQVLEQPSALWMGRERRPSLKDVEQAYIRHVLEQVQGNQTRAASVLGISRKALWEKRRRYGMP